MTNQPTDADREFAIADAVHHDLHIAPDAYGQDTIWLHDPAHPDRPQPLANQARMHPLLWAILTAAIPTRDDEDAAGGEEPSHWYAEGYSVGAYGTPWPKLDGLDDPDLDEFDRGHTAGRTAAAITHGQD